MCNKSEALQILESVYQGVTPLFPVSAAYLYGSYARGDHTPDSDVDIMVVSPLSPDQLRVHRKEIAHLSSELSMVHDVTVSLTVRSESQFRPQQIPYYRNVLRDGIRYDPSEEPVAL